MIVWRLETENCSTEEKHNHGLYATKELAQKAKEKLIQEFVDFDYVCKNDVVYLDNRRPMSEISITAEFVFEN